MNFVTYHPQSTLLLLINIPIWPLSIFCLIMEVLHHWWLLFILMGAIADHWTYKNAKDPSLTEVPASMRLPPYQNIARGVLTYGS